MRRHRVGGQAWRCLGTLVLIAGTVVSAQPLDRLTPTPADLERLRVSVEPGPVVMVNLLKFKADGGREAYQRYTAIAGPLFLRAGAEIVYAGTAGPLVAAGQRVRFHCGVSERSHTLRRGELQLQTGCGGPGRLRISTIFGRRSR